MTPDTIEARISPLVEALNATGLIRTFSSCEGHYGIAEQTLADRNHAEVRFVPAAGVATASVETLLVALLTRFKARHGLLPVHVIGYKLYTPLEGEPVDQTFVLELRPFNRFDSPEHKRDDTDRAVAKLIPIVDSFSRS